MTKRIAVLTGAGISAESGLKTFRDSDGLWNQYSVYEVATPEAWENNPELVLTFYNERRKQAWAAQPNAAHVALAELEKHFDVTIVTQNIDDLHERAGSKNIIHLHGEIKKARSTSNPDLVYVLDHWELNPGDLCELGSQLRPHIVWFGEDVPMMEKAIPVIKKADILIVVGTSLEVYPAAGLTQFAGVSTRKFLVDPKKLKHAQLLNFEEIIEKASTGVPTLVDQLITDYKSQ